MNYQISNEDLTVAVSSRGAEIQSIVMDGTEYLWDGNPKYWPERSPILFPYVGRFTEGKYRFKGREYEMDIHGFARKMEYRLVEKTDDSIRLCLFDNEETYRFYPFHFEFEMAVTLKENKIDIGYKVRNLSKERMYFGIGGHPGFRVPLENGLDFSDYYLEFEEKSRPDRVGHTKSCYLSGVNKEFKLEEGQILRLRHDMFDEDAIVLQNMAGAVTLKSACGAKGVKVSYPDLPYLGLWHAPGTAAEYICIEPWSSLPSRDGIIEDIEYKNDLIRLGGGEQYESHWEIMIF